jgi:hypothetical protein
MVAEKVKALFNDVQILESDNKNEIAFVTPLMCEKDARAKIDTLDVDVKNILRVLDY